MDRSIQNRARRHARLGLAVAVFALAACGCHPGEAEQGPSLAPAPAPREGRPADLRVASLDPLATRFVLALGAEGRLVAVDVESARLPGVGHLPVVADETQLRQVAPDVVLEAEPGPEGSGFDRLAFAPHDLEDAAALSREVGARLVGPARALRFETAWSRPLARLAGSAFGRSRPRVAAVIGIDPLALAGGHSFETDLIEIAGATSVTHGGEEPRLPLDLPRLTALAPDLLVFTSPQPLPADERARVRAALPADLPVAFFDFDPGFWLEDPVETAVRMREAIAAPDR